MDTVRVAQAAPRARARLVSASTIGFPHGLALTLETATVSPHSDWPFRPMDIAAFRRTFTAEDPPAGLTRQLRALWYAGNQYWDRAHALIQTQDDADSCRIHAHLHRLDGDLPNAAYWYARAGLGMPDCDTEAEWEQIVTALLAREADQVSRR